MPFIPDAVSRRYYQLAQAANHKGHVFVVNLVLLAIGFYFPIQKLTDVSASNLIAAIFSLKAAIIVKFVCIFAIIYCALAKLLLFCVETFPSVVTKLQAPDNLNECILAINEELRRQIIAIRVNPTLAKNNFTQLPNFEINVPLIVQNMGNHLRNSFTGIKVKNSDIFISVYKISDFEKENGTPSHLEYVIHFDHKRDTVHTKKIPLSDPNYSDYECVKVIKSNLTTKVRWDCSTYKKSKNSRTKTIKHYVGFRLDLDNVPVGFINVEFHKHDYFPNEEAMKEFVERELHVFRCFIEYHFLKKKIHALVHEKLIPAIP